MSIDARFKDALNFRDLGGLKTEDGKAVKPGVFYRGAGLCFFDEKELDCFKQLKIKTIMDLRSASEIEELPDPDIKGAKLIRHSGLIVKGAGDIDWSPKGMARIGGEAFEQLKKIEGYYRLIAFDNTAFKIMMEQIVEDNVPLYFHCATGKDRTGVAAMIILMALGVKKEEIRKDYLLSNTYRQKILEKTLAKVADIAKEHPEINELLTLQDGVREKTFDIVISSIKEKYGNDREYLYKEFALDEETLNGLREKYLI
ncbi:MAG: tyrosine-protein phosphatase [Erysipelotrichaceae bacterium]|nr:tyrosine-protein phosphatase [Erysipelotrichaceae bacterium]